MTSFVLMIDKTTAFAMCPQELVLSWNRLRRIKETLLNSVPAPISAHLFSHLPFEHFYLNLLLVAFVTAANQP